MTWYEIITHTTHEGSELVADVMMQAGAAGVNIVDSHDVVDVLNGKTFWDYVDDSVTKASKVEEVTVKGYVHTEVLTDTLQIVRNGFDSMKVGGYMDFGKLDLSYSEIKGEDWFENWKKFYSPIYVGDFCICPVWENASSKYTVKINPGAAFGTGEHDSTRMCLQLLSETDVRDKDVLDIGAGSGILGISALIKGAGSAYLTDIDEGTLNNCRENAKLNGVIDKCTFACADLVKDRKADVIFANITADVLIRLADNMMPLTKQNTVIILSGIINQRLDEVRDAYIKNGFKLLDLLNSGEWNGLKFGV